MLKKLLAKLLKGFGPGLVALLLAEIDPTELADKVKPYLKTVMDGMDSAWKKNFATAITKVAAFVTALAKE